jgi:hypothetical protein
MKRIIPNVLLAGFDRSAVFPHRDKCHQETPVSGAWVELFRLFELGD